MNTKIITIPAKSILTPADLIVPHRAPGSTEAALLELSRKSQEVKVEPVKVLDVTQDEIKEMFERQFGCDQDHRTKEQWVNLVNQYGWPVVVDKEGMTQKQIMARMRETLTKRMKRLAALKNRQN